MTMTWRWAPWQRWLGWTAVFATGATLFSLGLASQSKAYTYTLPWGLDTGVLFLVALLALVALAFGIGVRLAAWWWVWVVFGVSMLQLTLLTSRIDWGPPQNGAAQAWVGLFLVFLVTLFVLLVAAVAGVGWGKARTSPGLRRWWDEAVRDDWDVLWRAADGQVLNERSVRSEEEARAQAAYWKERFPSSSVTLARHRSSRGERTVETV
jgi:hypothetical protein